MLRHFHNTLKLLSRVGIVPTGSYQLSCVSLLAVKRAPAPINALIIVRIIVIRIIAIIIGMVIMVVIVRSCMLQLQAALRADVGEAGEELAKSTVQPFSLPLLLLFFLLLPLLVLLLLLFSYYYYHYYY